MYQLLYVYYFKSFYIIFKHVIKSLNFPCISPIKYTIVSLNIYKSTTLLYWLIICSDWYNNFSNGIILLLIYYYSNIFYNYYSSSYVNKSSSI